MNRTAWVAVLALLGTSPAVAQSAGRPVAEVANVRFYSDELMNLHHTLYAAAWRAAPRGGRSHSGLAQAPTAPFTPEERAAWDEAVRYYDRELASKDLLFGEGMIGIKYALVHTGLDDPAIAPGLRAVLRASLPVYRSRFWPEHDRVNRAWIAVVSERMATLAPEVIPRLETLYGTRWFATPERADVVWVGSWAGAYATDGPPHATMSSTHPSMQDQWLAAETVFHEVLAHPHPRSPEAARGRARRGPEAASRPLARDTVLPDRGGGPCGARAPRRRVHARERRHVRARLAAVPPADRRCLGPIPRRPPHDGRSHCRDGRRDQGGAVSHGGCDAPRRVLRGAPAHP